MSQFDAWRDLVKVKLFLVAEGIDPSLRVLFTVCDQVGLAASHVLSVELQGPLDLDLLHAAVLGFTLYIRGRLAESLRRVQVIQLFGGGLIKVVLSVLPFVTKVYDRLGLMLQ